MKITDLRNFSIMLGSSSLRIRLMINDPISDNKVVDICEVQLKVFEFNGRLTSYLATDGKVREDLRSAKPAGPVRALSGSQS